MAVSNSCFYSLLILSDLPLTSLKIFEAKPGKLVVSDHVLSRQLGLHAWDVHVRRKTITEVITKLQRLNGHLKLKIWSFLL